MNQRLKNLLSKFTDKKRSPFFVLLSFIIIGIVLPTHSTQAAASIVLIGLGAMAVGGIAGWLAGIPVLTASIANIITAIVVTFLQIPLLITNAFLSLSAGILYLSTSPGFISLSYTNPSGNPLLEVGWTLTRDLTNMAFVIALVIIGLATALKIQEYRWQKTLPLLIGIALLINFTPVLLGLVVDASNILMNFFLGDGLNFDLVVTLFKNHLSLLVNTWGSVIGSEWHAGPLAKTIALTFFGFIAGFMFLVFALLFIMRYIAIWMLVILSPIAFFSYILPATRGFWKTWWNQFTQWCFIGVTAAFFLYLSMHLADLARPEGDLIGIDFSTTGESGSVGGLLNDFLPYAMVIAFMVIGFFTALSTSAMGASGVIAGGQKLARATPAWLSRRRVAQLAMGKVAGGAAAELEKAAEEAQKLEERGGVKGAMAKPLGWVTRAARSTAVPSLLEYAARKRKFRVPSEFDEMSSTEQAAYIKSTMHSGDQIELIARMAKNNTLKYEPEIQKIGAGLVKKFRNDLRYSKEVGMIMDIMPDKITAETMIDVELAPLPPEKKQAKREELKKEINALAQEIEAEAQIDVRLNSEIEEKRKEAHLTREQYLANTAAGAIYAKKLKPEDLRLMISGSLTSLATRIGSRDWTSRHLGNITANRDKATVEKVLSGPGGINAIFEGQSEEEGKKRLEKLYEQNPRLVRFFTATPPGREWDWKGMEFMPEGFAEFEKRIREEISPGEPSKERLSILRGQLEELTRLPSLDPEETKKRRELQQKIKNLEEKLAAKMEKEKEQGPPPPKGRSGPETGSPKPPRGRTGAGEQPRGRSGLGV